MGICFFQRQVAQFTRACWFDRAGLGMERSEPHRTDEHGGLRRTCTRLLHAAGVSFAVCLGRFLFQRLLTFASLQANTHRKVAGAVLVDSAHEDQYRYEPRVTLGPLQPASKANSKSALRLRANGGARGFSTAVVEDFRASQEHTGRIYGRASSHLAGVSKRQPKSFVAAAVCDFEKKSLRANEGSGQSGRPPADCPDGWTTYARR